jgi:hypothetical protein
MANFYFDGNNNTLQTMINSLSQGTVYNKEYNIVPYINDLLFVESFSTYSIGTAVSIYINNSLITTQNTDNNNIISTHITPPLGKFNIIAKINGQIVLNQDFISMNLLLFFLITSKALNVDNTSIFQMFANLYYDTLDDSLLYNKIGWYFNFQQGNLDIDDYRRMTAGDTKNYLGLIRSFIYATTIMGLSELVYSFTETYPTIYTYRDFIGNIMLAPITQVWNNYVYFYLDGTTMTSNIDITSTIMNNETLTIQVDNILNTIQFSTENTPTAIINTINLIFPGLASIISIGGSNYIKLYSSTTLIHIINGTGLSKLGFSINQGDDIEKGNGVFPNVKRVTYMDKTFVLNTIRVLIRNWTFDSTIQTQFENIIKLILPVGLKIELIYGNNLWTPLIVQI